MDDGHIRFDAPGGHALFTTRHGGVSAGPYESLNLALLTDDAPAAVAENRRRLARLVGVERFMRGRQVHEARVRALTEPPPPDEVPQPADGQATSARDLATIVVTADCLPIALIAPEAVAMVHAGWRGLAAGVIQNGVEALRRLGATSSISAAVGPGAGPCCYEVGDEVRAQFEDEVVHGRHLDLREAARRRLEAAGVHHVHDTGVCTMCSPDFFSHRRDGGITGRQAGVAWRAS